MSDLHFRERHVPISEGFCPECLVGLISLPRLKDNEIRSECPACGTVWAINRNQTLDEPGWCCTTHRKAAR